MSTNLPTTAKKLTSRLALGAVLMASISLSAVAAQAAKGHLNVTSTAEKVITVLNDKGEKVKQRIPAAKVLPGEIVMYTTTFENISNENAEGIGITNPIPEHTVYLHGTAQGAGCTIDYSVDGGKKWGQPNTLKVKDQNGKPQPAKPADYTHIRWDCAGKLTPKQKKAVSFQVQLL